MSAYGLKAIRVQFVHRIPKEVGGFRLTIVGLPIAQSPVLQIRMKACVKVLKCRLIPGAKTAEPFLSRKLHIESEDMRRAVFQNHAGCVVAGTQISRLKSRVGCNYNSVWY